MRLPYDYGSPRPPAGFRLSWRHPVPFSDCSFLVARLRPKLETKLESGADSTG